jgi:hypothetical protein
MKIAAPLHDIAGVEEHERMPQYMPSKQKMNRAIDLNQNQAPGQAIAEPTSFSAEPKMIPASPSTATTMGHTEPCKVCKQQVPNSEPYIGTGFCSENCIKQFLSNQSAMKSKRPPSSSKGRDAASKPDDDEKEFDNGEVEVEKDEIDEHYDSRVKQLERVQEGRGPREREASKPSTSKGEKKAHMNAEEKKTVLYGTSKNPEPVPSNAAQGDKVKIEQPNVEDDEERKIEFLPGQSVKLKKKLSAPTRGGGRVIFNSGISGTVVRDQAGDGSAVYVHFNDGRFALVPGKYL